MATKSPMDCRIMARQSLNTFMFLRPHIEELEKHASERERDLATQKVGQMLYHELHQSKRDAIAACRAAVEAKLIGGALSLKGLTAMEQADAILAAIDAVEMK